MTAGVFEQFEPYRPVEDNRKPKEQPEAAPPPENEGGRLQSAPDQRERTAGYYDPIRIDAPGQPRQHRTDNSNANGRREKRPERTVFRDARTRSSHTDTVPF